MCVLYAFFREFHGRCSLVSRLHGVIFSYVMLCTLLALASGSVSQRCAGRFPILGFSHVHVWTSDGNLTLPLQRSLVSRGLIKLTLKGDLIKEKVVWVRIPAIVAEVRVPSKRIVKGAVVSQGRPINPVLSTSTVSKDRHLDLFLLWLRSTTAFNFGSAAFTAMLIRLSCTGFQY